MEDRYLNHHCSPSQVSLFEDCPRKWGFKYLDKIQGEPNRFAEFGKAVDRHLDAWLTERTIPTEGHEAVVARAVFPLFPAPQVVKKEHVHMKQELAFSDVRFKIELDLFTMFEHPVVWDLKTTSALRWALTEEDLTTDIQATLYATWALLHNQATKTELRWNYVTREKTPQTKCVRIVVDGRTVRPRVERTIETARTIQEVRRLFVTGKDLPYNANVCEKYGGCPYRSVCNLSPEEKLESAMSQMSAKDELLAKLKARQNGQSIEQPINPPMVRADPPKPPMESETTEPLTTNKLQEMLRQRKAAAVVETEPVVELESGEPLTPHKFEEMVRRRKVEAEPASVAEEPAKRGPGRPRKVTTTSPLADPDKWTQFFVMLIPKNLGILTNDDVRLIASNADTALEEYQKRFTP